MSRFDELIAALCPTGVKYMEIGAVVERASKMRWSDGPSQELQYIDLTSVDRTTHSIMDTETITRENAPSRAQQLVRDGDVLFGTTRPMLKRYAKVSSEFDGQVASTAYCVLRPKTDLILTNFLFHLLGTAAFYAYVEANERGSAYPAIPDGVVKQFRIPVPPLEAQREIVKVLDAFTELEAELEAKLTSEVASRQEQFLTVRSALLSFDSVAVTRFKLGDLATVRTGKAPSPGALDAGGAVPFVNAGTSPSGSVAESNTPGDTVTIPSRGQGGVGIAGYQQGDFWCGPLCYRIRSTRADLMNRYLFHYLSAAQSEIRGLQQTGGTPALNRKELVLVEVPFPDLAEQRRVADILDRCTNATSGLVADLQSEQRLRRQQYEYYRERLLTFEEAVA